MNVCRLIVIFSLTVLVSLPATGRKVVDLLESDLPHGVVPMEWVEATVNRHIITSGEIDEMLHAFLREQGVEQLDDMTYQEARQAVVEQAIRDQLIVDQAERMELNVRKEVLDAAVDAELRRQYRRYPSPEDFQRELELSGSTLSTWKHEMRQELERKFLIESFLKNVAVSGARVTDQEVQEFLQRHPAAEQEYERVLLRHILLKLPPDASQQQVDQRMEEMKVIATRLRSGESFRDVATQVSEDQESAAEGGNAGYFQHGDWPEAEEAFSKEGGEIFGPIRDDEGLHIVQVVGKQTVRDALLYKRRMDKLRSYLADLREEAEIDIKLKPFSLYRAERQRMRQMYE